MSILNKSSLIATLDKLNDALVDGGKIARTERAAVGQWIASRLGQGRGYGGMPSPTEKDCAGGAKLYTGEAMNSWAGMACKMGFEATRALVILDLPGQAAAEAREKATGFVSTMLKEHERIGYSNGTYCCCSCSAAMWRLVAQWQGRRAASLLSAGLKKLRSRRDDKGHWQSFPFWYTTLVLREIDSPAARAELEYAATVLEKALRRGNDEGIYATRRLALAQDVLGKL